MALSNILREPRREITESAVGIAVFVVIGLPLGIFAWWFANVSGPMDAANSNDAPDWGVRFVVGLIVACVVLFVGSLLARWTHSVGEDVCDYLKRHGRDPRPKERK